jgi:hypothetical protein
VQSYAGDALRVLVIASRDMTHAADWENDDAVLTDLALLCVIGIQVALGINDCEFSLYYIYVNSCLLGAACMSID